ncbi:MAG: hypothetical protein GSR85_04755 [Desulfurococcales archaeon]|nr:hypothetical protein [Desulfurococcales archaeon]
MKYKASKVVVDTDVLIDFLRGKKPAVEELGRLINSRIASATTVVNAFELFWVNISLEELVKSRI